MTTFWVCDKCGKKLSGIDYIFPIFFEERPHYEISRGKVGKLELCGNCNKVLWKKIMEWLKETERG